MTETQSSEARRRHSERFAPVDVGKLSNNTTSASTLSIRFTLPQRAWSQKRERQYEYVKQGLVERGRSKDVAEEIAERTVNKERARTGEAKEVSPTSTRDISSFPTLPL